MFHRIETYRIELWCSHCGGALVQDRIPAEEISELHSKLQTSLAPWLRALARFHSDECPGALELTTHPEVAA